jgi:selenocysteine-specific elongation factor
MIIGTAGHIDHGKTSLVRALTGIETDRLQEERTRGISIELGYAYVPVESRDVEGPAATLGFVDVPGHERFVHTMVAGATGIDVALLVVAADDGVMPQTREHLAILQLLGVDRGAVAVTKIDRVDAARIARVEIEIAALLAGTPLQDSLVFACNSTSADDAGINALRAHLHAWAAEDANAHRDEPRSELFRMPVDRVFSLAGHGTLVTGAVHGGVAMVGDHLQLMPVATEVRIRSIHAQNQASEHAMAGQRCALNLAAITRDHIHRGDWIADPRALLATTRIDVRLRLSALAAPLRDWTPLHIHWGTMHRQAHVVVLEDGDPGNGQLVQLVFDAPVCAMCGDRFIARDSAATHTLGGGVVLDPDPPQRRRRSPARLAWLGALEQLVAGAGIGPLLQHAPFGIPMAALQRYCRRAADRIDLPAGAQRIATREDTVIILASHWQALREQVTTSLRGWHERRPDEPGVDSGRLQRSTLPALAASLWNALLQDLLADGALQRVGAWWRLPGHDHAPPERERHLLDRVLPPLHAGGFDPPWVRTLAAEIGLAEDDLRAVLRRAAARGELFQIVPDLFYAPARIAELAAIVAQLSHATGTVDAAAFRDAIGLGRKRSIQILEFFNRVGYTRRVGDHHRPRGDLQWNAPHG